MSMSDHLEGFTVRPDAADDAENTPPGAGGGAAADVESREGLGAMSVLNERNSQLEEELAKVKDEAKTLYVGYEKTKARLKETKEIYSNVGKEVGEMEDRIDDLEGKLERQDAELESARHTIAEGQVSEAAARAEAEAARAEAEAARAETEAARTEAAHAASLSASQAAGPASPASPGLELSGNDMEVQALQITGMCVCVCVCVCGGRGCAIPYSFTSAPIPLALYSAPYFSVFC